MNEMEKIAEEINRLSESHAIGSLQDIRKDIRGLSRRAAKGIFAT